MKRHTPLRARNAKRLAKLKAKQFGPQAALCRTLPCCACNARPPSGPHHVKLCSNGGLDVDTAPLCFGCHTFVHAPWGGRVALEKEHGVNLRAVADRLAERVGV